ncbi:ABC transporter permease [Rathayibacter sp. AY1E9]|uniref:ABC transporter permease n=1 Tax=unclassified Rathayibacter TaxID=2609250 RepID=UPI000CE7450D|nr:MULTISPECIES: ABC transporter permease [unclassified Rathayibacter]PPG53579.1 ABC transporter permease [Rathayibacter sp. AY1E9]PPG56587.1 ABC transporter permease [Rathayibacter sp. AY1C5]
MTTERTVERPAGRLSGPGFRRAVDSAGHTGNLGLLLVVVIVVFSLLNPSIFPTALNLQSIGYAVPEVGLLALAVAITMSSGGIDLSIVAIANLAALAMATTSIALLEGGASDPVAAVVGIAVAVVVGLVCGLVNGVLVSRLRIAPILATLATMTVFTGAALVLTRGEPVYGLPDTILDLGIATVAIVPVTFWLFVAVVALLWAVMNRTGLGLRIILVGASPEASDYTGIRRSRVLLSTYAMSGAVAAIAGVMMSARSASATADYGSSYLLLAITIAVLGGTNPTGGRAPIVGVGIGALVLQCISSGFNGLQISPYIYQIVQGLILVVVLVLEVRRGRLTRWLRGITQRPARDGEALRSGAGRSDLP